MREPACKTSSFPIYSVLHDIHNFCKKLLKYGFRPYSPIDKKQCPKQRQNVQRWLIMPYGFRRTSRYCKENASPVSCVSVASEAGRNRIAICTRKSNRFQFFSRSFALQASRFPSSRVRACVHTIRFAVCSGPCTTMPTTATTV